MVLEEEEAGVAASVNVLLHVEVLVTAGMMLFLMCFFA